jgi:hypothetical protein
VSFIPPTSPAGRPQAIADAVIAEPIEASTSAARLKGQPAPQSSQRRLRLHKRRPSTVTA